MRSLLLLLLTLSLFADVTLDAINAKPASLAKNFMIWRFLHQEITSQEADEAFYQFRDVDSRLFKAYAKKSDREEVTYTAECLSQSAEELAKSNDISCVKIAFSPGKASVMKEEERNRLARLLNDGEIYTWMKMMDDLLQTEQVTDLEKYTPSTFMYLFLSAGMDFRQQHLNRPLPSSYLQPISNHWGFSRFVVLVVTDSHYATLQKELLKIGAGTKMSAETHFYLAMNAVEHGREKNAMAHLKKAHKLAYYRSHKDKALFWQYLIAKDKKRLEQLGESTDINIYSLYAKEKLGIEVSNFYTALPTHETNTTRVDLDDPFVWNRVLKEVRATPREDLKKLADRYANKEMLPLRSFIYEKATGYKEMGFIMPYDEYMEDRSNDDKAIYYALMRQESRFIPAALSRSYALGLMQMMPFLVKALDKSFNEERFSYEEMFNPEKNIAYAKKHIDWLKKSLYHPLLMAYAYNGGIGFTKRYITEESSFSDAKYEPFISMEMMANSQSREYGKKVLSNYVIYKKILGEKVSILALFDKLLEPSECDRFRASK
ncbi:MAG: lytic transglycosylase domain-containing protein [Thiovulaceae bacterium]|nr:lytic transglycosylase domain-containing protein [Sulfurimonadaceae bacterium]